MKRESKPTKLKGIYQVDKTTYRVRFKTRDPKTDRVREVDRLVEADSPEAAYRERLRIEAELAEPVPEVMTLRAYAASWMRTRVATLRVSTARHYAAVLDNHILPSIGDYLIQRITRDDVVALRDSYSDVLPVTANGRINVLRNVLQDAYQQEIISRNPCMGLPVLRTLVPDAPAKSLTADELGRVLFALRENHAKWYPFFYTLAFTGLRFGEATALQWRDIDTDRGVIRIQRSQWRGKMDLPKNGKTRTVPLLPEHLEILMQHQKKQLKLNRRRSKVAEIAVDPNALVFPAHKAKHGYMHVSAARVPLLDALERAGITQRFTVHGFRHTFNNLLRQSQVDSIVLRSMTGHSSERLTETYSAVSTGEQHRAVSGLLRLVSGDSVGTGPRADSVTDGNDS